MAAIAFPSSPSLDDIFTSGNRSWKWTGSRWTVIPTLVPPSRLSGVGAETGDILVYDGSAWQAVPLTEGGSTIARAAWDEPYHYYGTAPTGTAESSTGWTITRITTDANGSVTATQSATGAWSNRTSLSYS
jgi:hypothetical protein